MNDNFRNKTIGGFLWRLLQNVSTQAVSFVIQVILARILMPEDYAAITIITVFLTFASVFISTGFSTALIQRKKLESLDYSSVFYAGLGVSLVLYVVLFASAPFIAEFYDMPLISPMLRIQALCIVIGALSSVHQALMTKHMQFKKGMIASLSGCIAQGVVGITLALKGYGAWSLVLSYLCNNVVICLVLWRLIRWHPKWEFSFISLRELLSFSLKVLGINLFNTAYNNVVSLTIGRSYDKMSLSYYNRGNQFPSLVMVNVDGAMNTVLFSVLSSLQDDLERFMQMLRRSMRVSLYVCSALMLGMFVVAEPMIQVILTDKWLGAVPYVRIGCLTCLLWPLSAINQALTARGQANIALWINIGSKLIGLLCLLVASQYSVFAFVLSSAVSAVISHGICMVIYHRVLGYKFEDQLQDIVKSTWYAVIMSVIIYPIEYLALQPLLQLILMVVAGVCVFVFLSWISRAEEFQFIITLICQRNRKTEE